MRHIKKTNKQDHIFFLKRLNRTVSRWTRRLLRRRRAPRTKVKLIIHGKFRSLLLTVKDRHFAIYCYQLIGFGPPPIYAFLFVVNIVDFLNVDNHNLDGRVPIFAKSSDFKRSILHHVKSHIKTKRRHRKESREKEGSSYLLSVHFVIVVYIDLTPSDPRYNNYSTLFKRDDLINKVLFDSQREEEVPNGDNFFERKTPCANN